MTERHLISRRRLLQVAGGGVVGLGFGALVKYFYDTSNLSNVLPTQSPVDINLVLQETATALDQEGKQFLFLPKEPFTEEMFRTIWNGTFRIRNDNGGGTAWLIRQEENNDRSTTFLFVTNKHVAVELGIDKPLSDLSRLFLERPGIDKPGIINNPTVVTVAESPDRDLAVVKLTAHIDASELAQSSSPFTTLSFRDAQSPSIGDALLVVGYPAALYTNMGQKTLGSVMEVMSYDDSSLMWWMQGINGDGSSGSPIAALLKDGTLAVIGVLFGKSQILAPSGTQLEVITGAYSLAVKGLIEEVDKGVPQA